MLIGGYLGLFTVALLAATLLPAQSEALLAVLITNGEHNLWLLIAFATLGNVIGSWINWGLGRVLETYRNKKWFPFSATTLERAQVFYHRYGRWTLLLSWVPVIGDPLTLVAGVMRERLWVFLCLVTLAKLGRYLVVAMTVSAFV